MDRPLAQTPFRKGSFSPDTVRNQMTEDIKIRNLALNTQASYLLQVSQYERYFGGSPELLGCEDIRAYQRYLIE